MFNYLQRLTVLATAVFLYFAILSSSPLTSQYYSIVYAAVIECGHYCLGTANDDVMRGDNEPNTIGGLHGNDQISGLGGYDDLHGGYGNDQLSGGPSDDLLYGSVGADSFKCGPGNDRITDFYPSEGDTKTNDCEYVGHSNHTGVSNETLTGPANVTLNTNNSSQ